MDELIGWGITLYVLFSVLGALLRRGRGPARPRDARRPDAAGGPHEAPRAPRSWEEELRELFEQMQGRAEEDEPSAESPVPAPDPDPRPAPVPTPGPTFPPMPAPELPPASRPAVPTYAEVTDLPAEERFDVPSLDSPAATGMGIDGWSGEIPSLEADDGEDDDEELRELPSRRSIHGAAAIRRRLRADPATLREMMAVREILGPPRALQPYRPPTAGSAR